MVDICLDGQRIYTSFGKVVYNNVVIKNSPVAVGLAGSLATGLFR